MHNNLQKFTDNERNLMTQFFKTFDENVEAYQFTEGNVFYDYHYITNVSDPSIFGEIKVRSFPIEKYPDYIIELQKLNNLTRLVNDGFDVQCANFFKNQNGTYDLIVFNIPYRVQLYREMGYEKVVKQMWMNETTFKSRSKKMMKDVILLKFDPMIDTKFEGFGWNWNK